MKRGQHIEKRRRLLELAKEGLSQKQIAQAENVSSTAIRKSMAILIRDGLVERIPGCPVFYELTEDGERTLSSLGVRKVRSPTTKNRSFLKNQLQLHDYKVRFRILKRGTPPAGGRSVKKHNWTAIFYDFERPFKHSIELTTKSFIVYLYAQELPRNLSYEQTIHHLTSIVDSIAASFAVRNGYSVDILHSKVVSQHISQNPHDAVDERVPDNMVETLRLGRHAKSVKGKMKQEAQAWLDKSKGFTDIETNDLAYEKMLLEMPLTVDQFKKQFAATAEYTRQLRLHIKVQEQQLRTARQNELTSRRMEKLLKRLADRL